MSSPRIKKPTPAASPRSSSSGRKAVARVKAKKPSPVPLQSAELITLWGNPFDRSYRDLYLDLRRLGSVEALPIGHRHHGVSGSGDEAALLAAELIEVASAFEKRCDAVQWFVTQGRSGLLPPRKLAEELGIEPRAFERSYFDGEGRSGVERDLRAAERMAVVGSVIAVVQGRTVVGVPAATEVVSAIRRARP